jgi:hypothetical protein
VSGWRAWLFLFRLFVGELENGPSSILARRHTVDMKTTRRNAFALKYRASFMRPKQQSQSQSRTFPSNNSDLWSLLTVDVDIIFI